MATITIDITEQDASLCRRFAEREGKTVAEFVRDALVERLEDLEDADLLEDAIAHDDGTRYTTREVLRMLELEP